MYLMSSVFFPYREKMMIHDPHVMRKEKLMKTRSINEYLDKEVVNYC